MNAEPIIWKIRVKANAVATYGMLATPHGREQFWAETADDKNGVIQFRFPNGESWDAQIVSAEPPRVFALRYIGNTYCRFRIDPLPGGGCTVELRHEDVAAEEREETRAGWVSVLLAMKAALEHGVDLRNHDPDRSWSQGYCDN